MKKSFLLIVAAAATAFNAAAVSYSTAWQPVDPAHVPTRGVQTLQPQKFLVYHLADQFSTLLAAVPANAAEAQQIDLPMPDGQFRSFNVWQTPMMEQGLADKYPGIYTFTAVAANDRRVTAKLDVTPTGFHAMVFDGSNTYFIDPYSRVNDGYYLCYYKHDYTRPAGKQMACEVADDHIQDAGEAMSVTQSGLPNLQYRTNGTTNKKYRLALACTGEYAQAATGTSTPTKTQVLSAMVTSVNRVNGVYERELDVTMTLIANEDTLIFLDGATDPYNNSNGGTMLGQNQTTVNNRIGSANYDIGHVFSTGGGGIASLGCVCSAGNKARGVTGSSSPTGDAFDIDYVAHEMGHQFGAEHTFNANTGSCSGNGVSNSAYEPGSGTTIMAYAGICGSGNDFQQNSDAYFHARSLEQISTYITTGNGSNCPTTTASPNANVNSLSAFSAVYAIPFLTPFELTAPEATDPNKDTLTYCWEEWNLGDFGSSWSTTRLRGPIFRSFLPDTSRTRIFPAISKLLANVSSYSGEKLPDTARTLRFKLTTRDIYQGKGNFNFPDDTIHLDVIYTVTPFAVTSPNTSAVSWTGGTNQTITWDVSATDQAPISCSNVDIYLSVDGGYTWRYQLRSQVPNNGAASVTVPNIATTNLARIKVKGSGNVFFDISNANFTITHDPNLPFPAGINEVSWTGDVQVYPVPAGDVLHISTTYAQPLHVHMVNAVGQQVWKGDMSSQLDVPVAGMARGMYYLQLTDTKTGEHTVKPVVLQ
jgi:hypothetical protein